MSARSPDENKQQGAPVIRFHKLTEPYGQFSNFARSPIMLSGRSWPTVEHYFQARKFAGTEHEEAIRLALSPMLAARMGRSRQRPLRSDWETVKLDVMLAALRAKFIQHDDLRELLLGTGFALLVEHRARDSYWGDGPDGSGMNMLGKLLMRVREEQRSAY
ncbi:MAG: NADAR family protein [Ktedonobacterales bacterium]